MQDKKQFKRQPQRQNNGATKSPALLEKSIRPRAESDWVSPQVSKSLNNLRRQSAKLLVGAELYPQINRGLPPINERNRDGHEHINLSMQAQTQIGEVLGMANRLPFEDPITNQTVYSLGSYWAYLMEGGGNPSVMSKPVSEANTEFVDYTRNLYAFFALALYTKFVTSPAAEDFKTLLIQRDLPYFDFYYLRKQVPQRVRSSVIIIAIFEALREHLQGKGPFDFFTWLDTDAYYDSMEEAAACNTMEERVALITRILKESSAVNRKVYEERRTAKRQKLRENRKAHQEENKAKTQAKPKQPKQPQVAKDPVQEAVAEQRDADRLVQALNAPTLVATAEPISAEDQAKGYSWNTTLESVTVEPVAFDPTPWMASIQKQASAAPVLEIDSLTEIAPPASVDKAAEVQDPDGNVVVLPGFTQAAPALKLG